jgi:cullin 4
MGLEYLRSYFDQYPDIVIKLIMGLLAFIEAERHGQVIDIDRIQRVLRMFMSIGIYKEKFESPMLQDSKRFFMWEGNSLIESYDVPRFLEHVEHRIVEAKEMVDRYLDHSSKQPLIEIIEAELFVPHISTLLDRGLTNLLSENRIVDLRRFYHLLERVHRLDDLKLGWINYIRQIGESYVNEDEKREKTLIDDILSLQDQGENLLRVAFNHQEAFKQAMKSSMISVLNLKVNRLAELLARYVDRKLRGEKGMQETDTEQSFDKVIVIFKLLQGKDVFEGFYKKFLAKRLLLGKSASDELERSMLSRLKTVRFDLIDGQRHREILNTFHALGCYGSHITLRRVILGLLSERKLSHDEVI